MTINVLVGYSWGFKMQCYTYIQTIHMQMYQSLTYYMHSSLTAWLRFRGYVNRIFGDRRSENSLTKCRCLCLLVNLDVEPSNNLQYSSPKPFLSVRSVTKSSRWKKWRATLSNERRKIVWDKPVLCKSILTKNTSDLEMDRHSTTFVG